MYDPFFMLRKLEQRITELEPYRYREAISIPFFNTELNQGDGIALELPTTFSSTWHAGEVWEAVDDYLWLQQTVNIPESWRHKKIVGLFEFKEFGRLEWQKGYEMLFYFQGKPYQGVDNNHMEVFFPENTSGEQLLLMRLWSCFECGKTPQYLKRRFDRAEIAWLDEKIDDLYYNAKVILETVKVLEEFSSERVMLLSGLNEAMKGIDWSCKGDEAFYQSLHTVSEILHEFVCSLEKRSDITITCVGHTHIDVAWMWRLSHTREKCIRSFSTVLRLMEQFPEYIFLQSQPQLYEYMKQDYPEVYREISQRVAQGRWEADGAMWLEADCNIPSGESLVRQILLGRKFFKTEFGTDPEHLWLPDVFGYSWALPQILKKSGLKTFMTTKISWNQYNRMPHDTFKWRGIDGSEILTHFVTTPEPWSGPGNWFYTYNGQITPSTVQGVWNAYQDKKISKDLMIAYGYGDGGGGVNRDMLEYRRRIEKMPGLPQVVTGKAKDFYEKLHRNVESSTEYVHTWDGELYLEYHRGTYTSQAYMKKKNRQLEYDYREVEWLKTLESVATKTFSNYNLEALEKGWKIILRNQFHDIIPGSSVTEVYQDAKQEYNISQGIVDGQRDDFFKTVLTVSDTTLTVINNSEKERSGYIHVSCDELGKFYDELGMLLLSQRLEDGYDVWIPTVSGLGFKTIHFRSGECHESERVSAFKEYQGGIESPFYKISWNQSGQITSLWDKVAQREVVLENGLLNQLQVFEDKPLAHDAWDIDIIYQEKMKTINQIDCIRLKTCGPLKAVIEFQYHFQQSTLTQEMILYSQDRRIDFKTKVDWREQRQLLKVAFPVDIHCNYATFDIQYGNVKRANHWNTTWDFAKYETVAHSWVDISEKGFGVALLNDCKYGHDVKGSTLRLTLIKSAVAPDPYQDQGEHLFTYSLLPHLGDFVEGKVHEQAYQLNQPLTVKWGEIQEKYKKSLFTLTGSGIQIDAIKRAEETEAVVIRLHEYTGARQCVTLSSEFNINSFQYCDLMERIEGEEILADRLTLQFKPYEIKTLLVTFK